MHIRFMNDAILCASENIELGGGPFGAVIVDKDVAIQSQEQMIQQLMLR